VIFKNFCSSKRNSSQRGESPVGSTTMAPSFLLPLRWIKCALSGLLSAVPKTLTLAPICSASLTQAEAGASSCGVKAVLTTPRSRK